jgi:hypothetical protein
MHVACPERFRARLETAITRAVPLERLLEQTPELDERAKVVRAALPEVSAVVTTVMSNTVSV